MFVEVILKATLFDYSLASSKLCIHTFTRRSISLEEIIVWLKIEPASMVKEV